MAKTAGRIVSLLPSATEMLYALGVQDRLYGVTHQCRYPAEAALKPQVIRSAIDSQRLTSGEIDAVTCKMLNDGQDIFVLDEKRMADAMPDLIITQKSCKVCAPYTNIVDRAVEMLDKRPDVWSMDPHNMEEIVESVRELGRMVEREHQAEEIIQKMNRRIRHIAKTYSRTPRVLAIEWMDPLFSAGHWIPEMVQIAGGTNMKTQAGEDSAVFDIDDAVQLDPEIIILLPCGFDTQRTVSEYVQILKHDRVWRSLCAVKEKKVFAVDADAFFSKPGIRTVEGIEILAKIIHPEEFEDLRVPEGSFVRIR